MTGYQMAAFFGTPVAVAILAWGLVGLHRLMPRPTYIHRDHDPAFRATNTQKHRRVFPKPV